MPAHAEHEHPLRVSDLRFAPGSPQDAANGLLGFVSFLLNGSVRVDGVAVRRTLGGRLTLAWPVHTGADGRRHPYLRPIDDTARLALEAQVLAAIGLQAESAP